MTGKSASKEHGRKENADVYFNGKHVAEIADAAEFVD